MPKNPGTSWFAIKSNTTITKDHIINDLDYWYKLLNNIIMTTMIIFWKNAAFWVGGYSAGPKHILIFF